MEPPLITVRRGAPDAAELAALTAVLAALLARQEPAGAVVIEPAAWTRQAAHVGPGSWAARCGRHLSAA